MTHPRSISILPISMLCIIGAVASGMASGGPGAYVEPDDAIVFMGDSITVASTAPAGFATLIAEAIKKAQPASNVQIHTAAKGGCGIKYLHSIFDSKAAVHKPAIVVILIGINDVRLVERHQGSDPAEFEQLLKKLVVRCQDIGAKTVVCSPIIRGEKTDGSNQYDGLIGQYVAACKKVSGESSSIFIDLRALFLERLRVLNPENTSDGHLSKDGVHPNAAGNSLIAGAILDAWSIPREQ